MLLFFSDLHVHAWPEFGAEQRLHDCISVLSDVREYAIKHEIRAVFFGGDLFHTKGVLFTRPYTMVAAELVKFRKAGITFYANDGNHDHEDRMGVVHALQPLAKGRLLSAVPSCGWRTVYLSHAVVTMFSFCDSAAETKRRVKLAMKAVEADKSETRPHIALMHHGFKSARVGSSLEYEVREPLDAAELELDKHFDLVLSGHYHAHQQISGCNGWYIGSPLEFTRSDRETEQDAKKGFIVLDERTMKWKLEQLIRPRFIRFKVGDEVLPKVVRGNFIDVFYRKADDSLDACLEKLRKAGARAINPVPEAEAKAREQKKRLNVNPALNPNTVLKRYVKYKKKAIKKQKLSRRGILRLGKALMRDVQQEE